MKKLILLTTILLSAITASAEKTTTCPFAQTRIGVPATVHFVQGDTFGYAVTAEEDEHLDRLSVAVKDMCLTFTLNGELSYGDPLTYDIIVYAPATPEVKLASNYEVTSLSMADDPDLAMTE